ncbi:MAG: hypothetical protein ACOCQY_00415 [Halorhabdus sp.]
MWTTFDPGLDWFSEVLPEGMPVGETTVVSGPGGSGKPLVGFGVVSAWLEAGGSVVFLLTNAGREFVAETMVQLYDFDVDAYEELSFVEFDPEMDATVDAIEQDASGTLRANLLDPPVWETAIDRASDELAGEGPGTLVFGTALNLFLFSDTYRDRALEAFLDTIEREDDRTYLFTVSTSAFAEDIARVESAADTVLVTAMDDQRLTLRGVDAASVPITTEFVQVPFSPEQIATIKSVSEQTRTSLIPTLKAI